MKSFHWYNDGKHTPYSEPEYTRWSSAHWNAIRMPLVDPVYTGITLGDPSYTCRVHQNTTGKTVENALHWNAIGETLTIAAYTETPLVGLQQPTHTQAHIF